tara:strand:- start:62 stop:319 length:258 start_codon:yes stop_codon:yes gene_type:complete
MSKDEVVIEYKPEVTIKWGTEVVKGIEKAEEGYTIKTYIFENETQKAFFMKGVDEANGWLEYEVVEKGETISYVESNNPISRIIP